ncbi:putative anthranilate synthase [Rosa chinensis]|uniref:anthranilate synthase n=1 Tax=Rosa chinensis TaxID=74649 RepID=A0A2P6QPR2_ROSCH|nr:putative anthranilate synthase [Rosa chinensis]
MKYMGELGCHFEVYRNDELTVDELKRKNPRGVLISPGPGAPQDSGISLQTVLELGPIVPLFGVCMGLQCIGEAFGGKSSRTEYLGMLFVLLMVLCMGRALPCIIMRRRKTACLLDYQSDPFTAGRYHSLVIEKDSFPSEELEITAWTEDGLIMAARHKKYRYLQGVQFHPESIITSEGRTIVRNFVKLIEKSESESENN